MQLASKLPLKREAEVRAVRWDRFKRIFRNEPGLARMLLAAGGFRRDRAPGHRGGGGGAGGGGSRAVAVSAFAGGDAASAGE